ncbi:MAG: hypothetical protein ACYC0V_18955 [Armatimonadota bacterium]
MSTIKLGTEDIECPHCAHSNANQDGKCSNCGYDLPARKSPETAMGCWQIGFIIAAGLFGILVFVLVILVAVMYGIGAGR